MAYKAFLLGVNTHDLKYSESDSELMSVCLTQHGYEIIKPEKIEKFSILNKFEDMVNKCHKTDTVIFYFSGHGSVSKGKLRLVLDDANNFIRIDEIIAPLEDCSASNKLIILDCCNAGAFNVNDLKNSLILTACARSEKSQEINDLKSGFFTYQIHQALTDKSTEIFVDQKIKIYQLYEWLKNAAKQHNVKHSVTVPIPNLYANAKNYFQVAACESKEPTTDNNKIPSAGSLGKQAIGKKNNFRNQNNIPDLRPHLINRTDQKIELRKAIRKHNKKYPFFCLIHGDNSQYHDRYLERMVRYDLPKPITLYDNDIPCIPLSCRFDKDVDTLHEEILEQLKDKYISDNLSEIIDLIRREKRSILFYTSICTKDWLNSGGMKPIHDFIKFWKNWSFPSHHNHLLLICISFKYTEEHSNFFSRWFKKNSINNKIRQEFEQLNLDEFGVNGIVLPELENINKSEVEDWAITHLRDYLEILKPEIDSFFHSDQTKTMEDLVKKFTPLLKHCT